MWFFFTIITGIGFALGTIFSKTADQHITPWTQIFFFGLITFVISAVITLVAYIIDPKLIDWTNFKGIEQTFYRAGVTAVATTAMIFVWQFGGKAAVAIPIIQIVTVLGGVGVALLLLQEKITLTQTLGIFLCVIGVSLLTYKTT